MPGDPIRVFVWLATSDKAGPRAPVVPAITAQVVPAVADGFMLFQLLTIREEPLCTEAFC